MRTATRPMVACRAPGRWARAGRLRFDQSPAWPNEGVAVNDIEQLSIDTIRALPWTPSRRPTPGIRGPRWRSRRSPTSSTGSVMRANPANPTWPDRDRFVLSAGHACILQYATLHLTGYNLSIEELKRFRQWESLTPGHPEHFLTPGVETTTGPLGQGISNAVGMAMAEKFLAQRYNRPGHEVVDHRVYVIASDGDLMEGVSPRRPRSPAPSGSASSSSSTTTTGSRSTARPRSRSTRRTRAALRGLRLARPARRGRQRPRPRSAQAITRGEEREDRPSLVRRPQPHRLPGPACA